MRLYAVGPKEGPQQLGQWPGLSRPAFLGDQLVAVSVPDHLYAIGLHYRDFEQVSDGEVISIVDRSHAELEAPQPSA